MRLTVELLGFPELGPERELEAAGTLADLARLLAAAAEGRLAPGVLDPAGAGGAVLVYWEGKARRLGECAGEPLPARGPVVFVRPIAAG